MRSNRDPDSKTLRHNRQGLTPREPPPPPTLHLSQNNNREERSCRRRGARFRDGSTPPCSAFGLSIANSHQLSATLALKPLEIPGKGT